MGDVAGNTAVVSLLLMAITVAPAQDTKGKSAPPGMETMMKKWAEVSTPGAPHQAFKDMVGSWEVESKMWMNGPGSPPEVTKGTADFTVILGGRFLRQQATGTTMGMPMNGIGITGYDNFKKKYTGFWIDNTATAMFTMEGTADPSGKVITCYGTMDEWMTGEHSKMVKYVSRMIGKDRASFEIHDLSLPEPNTLVVEMTYTRKK